MEDTTFRNSIGIERDLESVVAEILAFMEEVPDATYSVTIGTDSELCKKTSADFVTAIVIHRVGNGGRYFWRRVELKDFYTIRDRILREVLISLDAAKEVVSILEKLETPGFSLEIHVDVGENGETSDMIQELVGMVRAHDFEAKTKPHSYAASSVADRLV